MIVRWGVSVFLIVLSGVSLWIADMPMADAASAGMRGGYRVPTYRSSSIRLTPRTTPPRQISQPRAAKPQYPIVGQRSASRIPSLKGSGSGISGKGILAPGPKISSGTKNRISQLKSGVSQQALASVSQRIKPSIRVTPTTAVPISKATKDKLAALKGKAANDNTAPAKRKSQQVVLGSYPNYVKMSNELYARRFQIPLKVWTKMTPNDQWSANQRFLDRLVSRRDEVVLATPVHTVEKSSFFAREIEYLKRKGYQMSGDGMRMYPKD